MRMRDFNQFKLLVNSPKKVVIVTHYKPDADALGSSLGLAGLLKKKGHQVSVITPSDYPDFLHWMKGNDEVINYEKKENEAVANQLVADADLIFCLDFNCLKRINSLGEKVRDSKAIKVLIDHHLEPEDFAEFEYWSTEAAATAELVYDLVVKLGDKHLIDVDIAEALYAGIMTDTGQFKHPNTNKNVHIITAELMEIGADVSKVGKLIYDNNSIDRIRFIGFALSERLTILPEYNTAFFAISRSELQRFNSKTGDTEGLVNYALSIKGIALACLITEREDGINLSLRSKGDFSVNEFARENFDGGGHQNAAGGRTKLTLEETVKKFLALLPKYKHLLNKDLKKEYTS